MSFSPAVRAISVSYACDLPGAWENSFGTAVDYYPQ